MHKELLQLLKLSEDVQEDVQPVEGAIAVINGNHYCEGFRSIAEAQKHLRLCAKLRRKGLCAVVATGDCQVCHSEELIKLFPELARAPFRQSHPFGDMDGGINYGVRVVIPLDFAKVNGN